MSPPGITARCNPDTPIIPPFYPIALQDAYKSQTASVLEFDLYHAEPLLPLSDDAIIDRMVNTYLAPALPGGTDAASSLRFKDASVLRFRKAVTRFSPGSHEQLPGISTSIPNLYVAGDCVQQGPGTHGCKGLSQEKAYVTGLQVRRGLLEFGVGLDVPGMLPRSGILTHKWAAASHMTQGLAMHDAPSAWHGYATAPLKKLCQVMIQSHSRAGPLATGL